APPAEALDAAVAALRPPLLKGGETHSGRRAGAGSPCGRASTLPLYRQWGARPPAFWLGRPNLPLSRGGDPRLACPASRAPSNRTTQAPAQAPGRSRLEEA